MEQSFKWKKLSFVENGENYSICLEYPYDIRNDTTGRILKPCLTKYGYYQIGLCENSRVKRYLHHQLIWFVFKGMYDTIIYDIDHIDRCRTNNHIENLRLVSKSLNNINMSKSWKGYSFDFYNELPDKIVINEECKVYYCRQYDKFFRLVVDKYREIHERKQNNSNTKLIEWNMNKKHYHFTTTHFRDNL